MTIDHDAIAELKDISNDRWQHALERKPRPATGGRVMDDLIQRAREALVDVTPGPWVMETVRTSCGTCHRIGPFPRPAYASKPEGWACVYDDYPPGVGSPDLLANSRFIAAARDLVPAMADRLEAQDALLKEALEALEFYGNPDAWKYPPVKVLDGLFTVEYENAASKVKMDRGKQASATLAKLRAHLDGRADEGGVPNGI